MTADGHESRHHPDEQELARAAHASDALQQLLAAASAPPSTAELKGRSRAVAAFRAAYRLRRPAAAGSTVTAGSTATAGETATVGSTATAGETDLDPAARTEGDLGDEGRTPAGNRRRTKLARARRWSAAQLTVAGAALLMLLGATAAAAAAGQLPAPLQETVSDLFNGSGAPDPERTPAPHSPSVPHPPLPVPSRTAPPPAASATSSPSAPARSTGRSTDTPAQLPGLCRAYQAAGPSAATLSRPGFRPLVDAAGGTSGVEGYCAALTGAGSPARTAQLPKAGPTTAPGRQPGRSHQPAGPHPTASTAGAAPAHPGSQPRLPAASKATGHPRR
ncbi:hypothetical protein [Jatrophihabitans sp.]|uniref:hypothetical protein n=1 Tax=Jatrophihabitans sp. TaxID=1932789 RepID=UPI002B8CF543|nr:hypothetical protein [Jatrophihabitans sp.]